MSEKLCFAVRAMLTWVLLGKREQNTGEKRIPALQAKASELGAQVRQLPLAPIVRRKWSELEAAKRNARSSRQGQRFYAAQAAFDCLCADGWR
ncbi:MAG: hypothetical protein WCV84_06105, partial [Patescibacteria group bacterium]